VNPGHLSYAPLAGGWILVASDRIVSLLDPSVGQQTIDRLWLAITSPDVTVESYVAAIPLYGADAVDRFAVVILDRIGSDSGSTTANVTVVLRGKVQVELSSMTGPRVVDGRDATPWYLAEFASVTGFTLSGTPVAARHLTRQLPFSSAVAEAAGVEWVADRAAAPDDTDLEDTVLGVGTGRRPPTRGLPAPDPDVAGADATAAIAIVPDARVTSRDAHGVDDATVLRPPVIDFDDARDGATMLPAPRARSAAPDGLALDGLALDGEAPGPPPTYSFRVGSGSPVSLSSAAYVGRRPSLPRIPRGSSPTLVRVDSPRSEVSSTHVEIRQEGSTVVVTDLRSTNGTGVSIPGMPRLTLRQGESLVVVPGTLIDVGDGNVVEILPAQ
jgi:hypothetical protein